MLGLHNPGTDMLMSATEIRYFKHATQDKTELPPFEMAMRCCEHKIKGKDEGKLSLPMCY